MEEVLEPEEDRNRIQELGQAIQSSGEELVDLHSTAALRHNLAAVSLVAGKETGRQAAGIVGR